MYEFYKDKDSDMRKLLFIFPLLGMLVGCHSKPAGELVGQSISSVNETSPYGMVWVRGGAFMMGANDQDATWSKTVYRIIDLREKQNLPLYFPLTPMEGRKNLMTIMLQGIVDKNLSVYKRGIDNSQFRPNFAKTNIELADTALIRIFKHDSISESVLKTVDGKLAINDYTLEAFMKYQQRFLVKEIWFFDKHRSVQDYQIEAIAPLLSGMPNSEFIRHIACWFKFNELRPLLTEEKILWGDNQSSDMTFDLFFSQRFYSGNILGVDDM